ncbi:Breast cancer 1, early onset [Entomortierella chlamydospora]|uniref:Breast cancer 1, early onset n=1 Tax=Entomortierella chlamydospora TaxID=101097 RepID=A0A9P6T101_9FUNG|nr:Breast cancer 1, early onset [Entomortierella chlamydospora]
MNATTKRNNVQPLPEVLDGEQESQQREILPDTIVGILLRMQEEFKCSICLGTMEEPVSTGCNHRYCRECILHALDRTDGCPLCKAHVTKRSLNSVEHLGRLIESFIRLKSAFEREDGIKSSHTAPEAQEHLPPAHSSSTPQQDDAFISESDRNSDKPENTLHTNATAVNQQPDLGPNVEIDLGCFDINLDTISAQEAASLAESMMSMMSSVTLGEGVCELPPSDPVHKAASLSSQSKPRNGSAIQQPDIPKIKLEDQDDSDLLTLSPNAHLSLEMPKLEDASILEEAGFNDCSPTQEPPSKETCVVLCGTFMSSAKKVSYSSEENSERLHSLLSQFILIMFFTYLYHDIQQQMENATKLLKSRAVDDLAVRPTHVVMDISMRDR